MYYKYSLSIKKVFSMIFCGQIEIHSICSYGRAKLFWEELKGNKIISIQFSNQNDNIVLLNEDIISFYYYRNDIINDLYQYQMMLNQNVFLINNSN